MIVYRIENEKGIGPYQGQENGPLSKLYYAHHDQDHPVASVDFPCKFSFFYNCGDFVFGFQSLQSCAKWFVGFVVFMRNYGFKLAKYEIDPSKIIIGQSGKQIIFKKSDAKKIE